MSNREAVISLPDYKKRKAAQRAFREWRRLFRTFRNFDENTRWTDLPDWVIFFLSEDTPESRLTIYDLLMGAFGLGNCYKFETLPSKRLLSMVDVYFIIMDQIRFECMRRLDWVEAIPWAEKSILEQVFEARDIPSPFMLKTPRMTRKHPAFNETRGEGDFDYGRFLRTYTLDAIKALRKKLRSETSNRRRSAFESSDAEE